jgi:hypothetical protein
VPHQLTIANPLPHGVTGVNIPNSSGMGGIPAVAGQVLVLPDTAFCYIPNYWFSTANSFGVAIMTDNGEISGS